MGLSLINIILAINEYLGPTYSILNQIRFYEGSEYWSSLVYTINLNYYYYSYYYDLYFEHSGIYHW